MAILFKPTMAQAILEGRKTVTRRRGKRRWKVGALHLCYTRPAFARPPGEPFARVRIVSVTEEEHPGASIESGPTLSAEGRKEGFSDWVAFEWAYHAINGERSLESPCWRVEFELVERLAPEIAAQVEEANYQWSRAVARFQEVLRS